MSLVKVLEFGGKNLSRTDLSVYLVGPEVLALPEVDAELLARTSAWPLLSAIKRPGRQLLALAFPSTETARAALFSICSPEDEVPKQLVVATLPNMENERFVYAICTRAQPLSLRGVACPQAYLLSFTLHGDVRFRSNTTDYFSQTVEAYYSTHLYVEGHDLAFPIIDITPMKSKSGGYTYRRWVPIRWRASTTAQDYPVDVANGSLNTATLIAQGKMQSDGDDLRVVVDGAEVYRWLAGLGTPTTKVWCNISFAAKQETTLRVAIPATGSITSIEAEDDISGFPSAGILMIDSEAFYYTARNNYTRQFLGVTRAIRGTARAAHSVGATIWWVQHDVWILYGNPSATTPPAATNYSPAFSLTSSSNTQWYYSSLFGNWAGTRSARWQRMGAYGGGAGWYTGASGTQADPWTRAGVFTISQDSYSRMGLSVPVKIATISGLAGSKWAEDYQFWDPDQAGWIGKGSQQGFWLVYAIPAPTANMTWQTWSAAGPFTINANSIAIICQHPPDHPEDDMYFCDLDSITVTLDSNETPQVTLGNEQTFYDLDATITTTRVVAGVEYEKYQIRLRLGMELNQTLQVNTQDKEVVLLADGSRQMRALELVGDPRAIWLPFFPSQVDSSTTRFEWSETGAEEVKLQVSWRRRYFW